MINIKGTLRSVSALDSNVYVLTNESGGKIGDLTIVDNILIDKIDMAMSKHVALKGEIRPGQVTRTPTVLPITFIMNVRK